MKRIKALLLSACVTAPAIVNAGVISDYALDTNTNIVTDTANNLEWLQWSVTAGMSINDALDTYSGDGWGLASNLQMAELFNAYDLAYGTFVFDSNPATTQSFNAGSDGAIEDVVNDRELQFVSTFGNTNPRDPENSQYSEASFADNAESLGLSLRAGFAAVYDDYVNFDTWNSNQATLVGRGAYPPDFGSPGTGVALVRGAPTVAVPEPTTFALLCLGLFGLGAARRTKQA